MYILLTRLHAILGVRPGEPRKAFLGTLLFFCFICAVVMEKSASNAMFLHRHDPAMLPILYMAVAFAVGIASYSGISVLGDPRRSRQRRWLPISCAAILLAFWVMLTLNLPVAPALYLFGELIATVLSIQFWSIMGEIYDTREGRRLYSFLIGGGNLGAIVSGLFVSWAGGRTGAPALLLLSAAMLVFCSIILSSLPAQPIREVQAPRSSLIENYRKGFNFIRQRRLLRILALVIFTGSVLLVFVDFVFRLKARSLYNEAEMTALFGQLNFYVGIISTTFALMFGGRFLQKFGPVSYLLIIPVMMAVMGIGSVASGGFAFIYGLKAVENAGSFGLNQPGVQIIYYPMPDAMKVSARSFIDGFVKKTGVGAGGLLIILIGLFGGEKTFLVLSLVLTAVYMILVVMLRKPYVEALDRIISGPRKAESEVSLDVLDEFNTAVVTAYLLSNNDSERLFALELVEREPNFDMAPYMPGLLSHDSERVRCRAIRLCSSRGLRSELGRLREIALTDSERRPKTEAIRAMAKLDPSGSGPVLREALSHADPGVRSAAIEGFVAEYGLSQDTPGFTALQQWLSAGERAPAAEKRELAKLLGRIGASPFSLHLFTLLSDPDPSVRKLAAQSAGELRLPEFVAPLLGLLSEKETRTEAREALAAYGDDIAGTLEQWINDYEKPLSVRIHIPRVLAEMGTARAAEVMLFSNIHDDPYLRFRIGQALSFIRKNHPETIFNQKRVAEATERRLNAYLHYRLICDVIEAAGPDETGLLLRALHDRLRQNAEIAFRLLGLIYDRETVFRIYQQVFHGGMEDRAIAIELLDNLVGGGLKSRLLRVVEADAFTEPASAPGSSERWLGRIVNLAKSKDILLSSIASRTLQLAGRDDLVPPEAALEEKMSKDTLDRLFFLESVEIFSCSTIDDLAAIAKIAKERRLGAGEIIFREGSEGGNLFIILEGTVSISKEDRPLMEMTVRDSFGETSLLDGKPHGATARAKTDIRLLAIDRTDFMDILSDRIELVQGILTVLTKRLREVMEVKVREEKK